MNKRRRGQEQGSGEADERNAKKLDKQYNFALTTLRMSSPDGDSM